MRTYDFPTCSVSLGNPTLIGREKGYFWFPSLHAFNSRDLLCCVCATADVAQGKWPAHVFFSRDSGRTWTREKMIESYGHVSTLLADERLLLMPYELWPGCEGAKRSARAQGTIFAIDPGGKLYIERTEVRFVGFERDLAEYHDGELFALVDGNIVRLEDGTLFITLYGKFEGDEKCSVFAFVSGDQGFTWRLRSVVASGNDVPEGTEGANEAATALLSDGRLLSIFRTGSGQDFYKCYSDDLGVTWTRPERMHGIGSVMPGLMLLQGNLLLLSGGRPGLFLWICTDGKGDDWARLNIARHHNECSDRSSLLFLDDFCNARPGVRPAQSTSYTSMQPVGKNGVIVCYDRLTNGWEPAPGPWGEMNAVFGLRVDVH